MEKWQTERMIKTTDHHLKHFSLRRHKRDVVD
jgi:hypothetical protein